MEVVDGEEAGGDREAGGTRGWVRVAGVCAGL